MAPKGKFFLIRSTQSGHYLDVSGASTSPGTKVILWSKSGNDNQVWYHHPVSNTIRSKASDLCLDIHGDRLVIDHYQEGRAEQQWAFNKGRGGVVENPATLTVLDVVGASTDTGAEVCAYAPHGGDNQKWEIESIPPQYFYISSATCGKVLDISGNSKKAGAKVILFPKKSSGDNQLWFEDSYGNIRSKLNDKLVLDTSSGVLQTGEWSAGASHAFWAVDGTRIVNKHNHGEVLDLKGACTDDGTEVCAWAHHGNTNQQWNLEYA